MKNKQRFMRRYLLLFSLAALVGACREQEPEKPKVIYRDAKPAPTIADTTSIAIADLPLHLTGTEYLVHPIGDLRIDTRSRYSSSAAGNGISYNVSTYSEFEISGFISNIKFQKIGADSLHVLTDKAVLIQSARLLTDKTSKYIVYTLADMDTNKDRKLDQSDVQSLYISLASGEGFAKLSKDFEELIDWRHIDGTGKVYFRTIEDTNKNGAFDKDDVIRYYNVNLADMQVSTYDPV